MMLLAQRHCPLVARSAHATKPLSMGQVVRLCWTRANEAALSAYMFEIPLITNLACPLLIHHAQRWIAIST